MRRPSVDVVLPFRGSDEQLERVAALLTGLDLLPGDSVTIADNRPRATDATHGHVRILGAGERQTSYHARNRAAALGSAPWIVFLDADVLPPPDLLDRYFAAAPRSATGVLAGAVTDEEPPHSAAPASRYAWLKSSMSQEITLAHDGWAFAQTANAAIRRRRPLLSHPRRGLGAGATRARRRRAPQPPDGVAHARPARASRRRRELARAALAGRAPPTKLAGPGPVEPQARGAGRTGSNTTRPRCGAARPARRPRRLGVRARPPDPQPPAAAPSPAHAKAPAMNHAGHDHHCMVRTCGATAMNGNLAPDA